jgi:hypothetical protein
MKLRVLDWDIHAKALAIIFYLFEKIDFMETDIISEDIKLAFRLISNLGPSIPEVDTITQNSDDSWVVAFDNDFSLLIEWSDKPSRLILTASLECHSSNMQLHIYEKILGYNANWPETNGIKIAMNNYSGTLIIMQEIFAIGLCEFDFIEIITDFKNCTIEWRKYVQSLHHASLKQQPTAESINYA